METPEEETKLLKKFQISFEDCKGMIKGVCDGCGGQLVPIETIDNSNNPTHWPHCPVCSKYHWGTPEYIHNIAKKMVVENRFIAYRHMDGDEHNYQQSQISGTCDIVRHVLKTSDYHQLKEENERLKGTIGVECVKQLIAAREENTELVNLLQDCWDVLCANTPSVQSLKYEQWITARDKVKNLLNGLSKFQPKKDERTNG